MPFFYLTFILQIMVLYFLITWLNLYILFEPKNNHYETNLIYLMQFLKFVIISLTIFCTISALIQEF